MKFRYCKLCSKTYFVKDTESYLHDCIKPKNSKDLFDVWRLCDKCFSPVFRSERIVTHRLFYPMGCIRESKVVNWYRSKELCEYNIDPTLEKQYNDLLNTRLIWTPDGEYTLQVINDPKERQIIDEEFFKMFPKEKIFSDYLENEYKECLEKRNKKDDEQAS